jgi:peroxiredoxin Q/BCP
MGELTVGGSAPDFALPGVRMVDGQATRAVYQLSGHRGPPMVLAFYPLDSTDERGDHDQFEGFDSLGARIWGIGLQDLDSHEKYVRARDYRFPLLTDTGGVVAATYGAMEGSAISRSLFLIDGGGVLRWKHVGLASSDGQTAEIREQILSLFPTPMGGAFSLAPPV